MKQTAHSTAVPGPARWLAAALFLLFFASGCSTKIPVSAASSQAQASTQRAAQAFSRADLSTAQREYQHALAIYDSLGDVPGRAASLLSLSRVASQAGQTAQALKLVSQVLADSASLPAATLATAHGRAATLYLAQQDTTQANQHTGQAITLCAGNCADAAALAVLRARIALQDKQPALAVQLASEALALPALAAQEQPTTKPQASAERANALRVRSQALLLLGQPAPAAASALEALALDRSLGLAERVLPDLLLLSQAHQQLGHTEMAGHYQGLAERARQAGQALNGQQQKTN